MEVARENWHDGGLDSSRQRRAPCVDALESFVLVFGTHCPFWQGRPVQISTIECFLLVLESNRACGDVSRRDFQFAFGELHATIEIASDRCVDADPVAFGLCSVEVVKELIKARDLCWFERLFDDKCPLTVSK